MIIFNHKKKGFPLKPQAFQGEPHAKAQEKTEGLCFIAKRNSAFQILECWKARFMWSSIRMLDWKALITEGYQYLRYLWEVEYEFQGGKLSLASVCFLF